MSDIGDGFVFLSFLFYSLPCSLLLREALSFISSLLPPQS